MTLLQMSFAGAIMILLITLIRKFAINKVPKNTFIVLWGIVILRLLIPFAVPSAFNIYSFFGNLAAKTTLLPAQTYTAAPRPEVPANGIASIDSSATSSAALFSIWGIIYISGLITISLIFIISYIKCVNEFKTSLPVNNKFITEWLKAHKLRRVFSVRKSDIISSPLTFGLFRPVILIPKNIEWNDKSTLAFILEHEFIHIKKFDFSKKLILTAALCLHWFNPLVWLMHHLSNRDIELACDEAVMRSLGEHTKSDYAKALIKMEEAKSGIAPVYNSFSKTAIEERIGAIMKAKTKTTFSIIISVAMLLLTATVFAACSPYSNTDNSKSSASSSQAAETNAYGSSDTSAVSKASGLSTQESTSGSTPEANEPSASSSISLSEYKELAESQPSSRLTENADDDIYGSEMSYTISVPEDAENVLSLELKGETDSGRIHFSDEYKYFIVRISNDGDFPINVDTDGIIYRIKPGDEVYIYSTRPSTSESHTVYFGTAVPGEHPEGTVDFMLSKEPAA